MWCVSEVMWLWVGLGTRDFMPFIFFMLRAELNCKGRCSTSSTIFTVLLLHSDCHRMKIFLLLHD